MDGPRASILILTWNSCDLVGEAVESALAQRGGPFDVVVLDNASQDGTPEAVARRFGPRVRLVCLPDNLGYAGGYNRGLALAAAPFVLLQNPDVRLAPDFLEQALAAFDDPRVGIVAGRLVRADGATLDSAGQYLARSRKVIDRGYGRPDGPEYDAPAPVLAACGAAALYRRAMIADVSDEGQFLGRDFFAYNEDMEIGWRAWRAGWRAVYAPAARATHLRSSGAAAGAFGRSFGASDAVLAHIVKNRYLAMLRHDRALSLAADLPFVALRELALWMLLLVKRPRTVRAVAAHRAAFARALADRRADRTRRGAWGAWRRAVPPRGIGAFVNAARRQA